MRLDVFEKALGQFQGELSDFEPALISTADAARAFDVFDAIEWTVMAAKTLVAARAASWMAQKDGVGSGRDLVDARELRAPRRPAGDDRSPAPRRVVGFAGKR